MFFFVSTVFFCSMMSKSFEWLEEIKKSFWYIFVLLKNSLLIRLTTNKAEIKVENLTRFLIWRLPWKQFFQIFTVLENPFTNRQTCQFIHYYQRGIPEWNKNGARDANKTRKPFLVFRVVIVFRYTIYRDIIKVYIIE